MMVHLKKVTWDVRVVFWLWRADMCSKKGTRKKVTGEKVSWVKLQRIPMKTELK